MYLVNIILTHKSKKESNYNLGKGRIKENLNAADIVNEIFVLHINTHTRINRLTQLRIWG